MAELNLQGTFPALVTPFNEDLSIDFGAFEKLIDFQIENGVEGIVVCGSTGESATLSAKEKTSLFVKAVEHVDGRIQVIAGTGSNNTQDSIALTKIAQEHGADAVLLVTPYYNKPTQVGLFQHFLAISEHADIPQIIYNVPGRTATNISPETQIKIAEECNNVVATKEASGNLEQMMYILKYAPEGFSLLSGDDVLTLPIISVGGTGVISVIGNYAPKEFGSCVRNALDGNWQEALDLHYRLFDLMQLNFVETNPVPVKAALAMLGMMNEYYRLPMIPMNPENKGALRKAMGRAGLL